MKFKNSAFTLFIAIIALISNNPAQDRHNMTMTGTFSNSVATGIFSSGFPKDVYRQPIVFIGDDTRVYRAVFENERLLELYIDGQQMTVDHITDDPATDRKIAAFIDMQKESARIEKQQELLDEEDTALDLIECQIEKKEDEADKIEDAIDHAHEKLDDDSTDKNKRDALRTSIDKKREKLDALRTDIERQHSELEATRARIEAKADAISNRWDEFSDKSELEMNKVLERIVSDLRAANIVSGSGKISFKLSNTELIVNGKTAPSELFERLKQIYVGDDPRGTFGYLYNWKLNWK